MIQKYIKNDTLTDVEKTLNHIELIRKISAESITKRWLMSDRVFDTFSEVYPFTNEAMKTYNQMIDLEQKDVLTVTASADQPIIAMLKKAKTIDTFDCNKLTYYHMFFKIAAIKALKYEEFIDLYTIDLKNYKKDPIKYYKELRTAIKKEDVRMYWDAFFSRQNYQEYFKLFFMGGCSIPSCKDVDYLSEDGYLKTQLFIHDNVGFKNIEISNLPSVYNNKYDLINLSNIMDYSKNIYRYAKTIKKLINNNLKDDGIIISEYVWSDIKTKKHEFNLLKEYGCNPTILEFIVEKTPFEGLDINSKFNINKNMKTLETNTLILCKKRK